MPQLPAMAYSAGVPFMFIPVRTQAALSRIQFDTAIWSAQLRTTAAPHVFAFTVADPQAGRTIHARMFAPAMGIVEDPATGAAAAALAGYLADHQSLADGTTRWQIEQGADMGRPSHILLELDWVQASVVAVRVGGRAVLLGRGTLDL